MKVGLIILIKPTAEPMQYYLMTALKYDEYKKYSLRHTNLYLHIYYDWNT